ncbi:GtrA family protein [Sporolactobacillus pectinivorans]|uniref:GtrA family protein n=1 Tax=Sporolactobacillus pectinivorans TaxID=1591408 RepID=UPI000C266D15|nr:GtrA family protein [Sporolactobacillus pectinivorans]
MKRSAEVVLYLIMGILTTIINIACFLVLIQFHMDYKIATTIAWIVSIIFAYITNKIYVFKSKTENSKTLIKEIFSFFWFRLLSYFIDLGSMILMVGFLKTNETLAKIIANVFVVVINYAFSKWFIFNRKTSSKRNI